MEKILKLLIAMIIAAAGFRNAKAEMMDTLAVKSKITEVVVFFSGAQVTRKSTMNVSRGKHILWIKELPFEMNPNSIQVKKIDHAGILSVKHKFILPGSNIKNKAIKGFEEQIKFKKHEREELNNRIAVLEMEQQLILNNNNLSSREKGISVALIQEAADFYRVRLNEIKATKLSLEKNIETNQEQIKELYQKINEEQAKKNKAWSDVFIAINAEKNETIEMNFSYYISSASWEPFYDFRVEEINKPLVIHYHALLTQNSGENWENVNIRLSNADPSLSGVKPELKDWFLGQKQEDYQKRKIEKPGEIYGLVIDEKTSDPIPFARIDLMKSDKRVITTTANVDGEFSFKSVDPGNYWIQCNYTGYAEKIKSGLLVKSNEGTNADVQMKTSASELNYYQVLSFSEPVINPDTKSGSTVTREEFQRMATKNVNSVAAQTAGVVQYGSGATYNVRGGRGESHEVYIDGQRARSSFSSSSTANEKRGWELTTAFAKENREALNLEYLIDIPYYIPSDGNEYAIKIKEVSVDVEYVYEVIPKLDPDAFLSAEITDWPSLKLISGKAGIYYQGTFKGETNIDVDQVKDTISLSLGRDKDIIVQREKNKTISEKKILGNTIRETTGIDITIKNNKNSKIRVKLEDQVPVMIHKSTDLIMQQTGGATVDEKHGRLSWDLKMDAGEKKSFTVQYTLKVPINFID